MMAGRRQVAGWGRLLPLLLLLLLLASHESTLSQAIQYFNENGLLINPNETKYMFVATRGLLARIPDNTRRRVRGSSILPTVSFSPQFTAPVSNVTVARGRDAKFTCLVRHLGGYRVGWVKADTKAIQAIHTHVITHNPRVHVSFDDHSTWHLLIKQVTEEDKGPYMCQINTDPMISQMGYLEVLRPPEIDDARSSGDVVATEGERVALNCVARGHPPPNITWVREDAGAFMVNNGNITKTVESWEGQELQLTRVSRDDMGAYLCIAWNSVPPQVSKRVLLHVHFHPIIHVPNQLISSSYGKDLFLECKVEASPKPVTFWQNSQEEMLMSSPKYNVSEEHQKPGGYAVHMRLLIRNLTAHDIGPYTCVAKNSIGEVESSIKVYYIAPATTPPPPPRLVPSFIETNRVETDGIDAVVRLSSPGLDAAPLDLSEKELFRSDLAEGSASGPWMTRPHHNSPGPLPPTSGTAGHGRGRSWLSENSDVYSTSSSSSSSSSLGFSAPWSSSCLSSSSCAWVRVRVGAWRVCVVVVGLLVVVVVAQGGGDGGGGVLT